MLLTPRRSPNSLIAARILLTPDRLMKQWTPQVLRYGRDEALPERRPLRTGPLTLVYEEADLRYIRLGDREVLRRVYVAVRDQAWGTVLPVVSNTQIEVREDSFRVSFDAEHKQGEVHFAWRGAITGSADGTIEFSKDVFKPDNIRQEVKSITRARQASPD